MIRNLLGADRRLVLLGTGPSLRHAPLTDEALTFWGVTQLWGNVPHLDCVVEIHDEADIRADGMWDQLNQVTAPVYTARDFNLNGNARRYPLEAVKERFTIPGRVKPPLGSSLDYLLALALVHDPPPESIAIFGFDMHQDTEYAFQRHTAGFWLGVAHGCGITLELPPESQILKVEHLYGIEAQQSRAAGIDHRERFAYFQLKYDTLLHQVSEALAKVPLLPARAQVDAIKLARQALHQATFLRGVATEAGLHAHRTTH